MGVEDLKGTSPGSADLRDGEIRATADPEAIEYPVLGPRYRIGRFGIR